MLLMASRLLLAACAATTDCLHGKIPNGIILLGYLLGISYRIMGALDVGWGVLILRMLWPILALFPVFLIRGMGAGDLKLFSLLSLYSEFEVMLYLMGIALTLSATGALVRMVRRKELGLRLWNLKNYAVDCLLNGSISPYKSIGSEGSTIHMGIYILLACFLVSIWEVRR